MRDKNFEEFYESISQTRPISRRDALDKYNLLCQSVLKPKQKPAKKHKPKKGKFCKRRPNKSPFVRPDYHHYIKSKAWARKRQTLFAARGKKCEICGSGLNVEVHHLSYERLGREKLKDLQIVCGNCHRTTHEDKGAFSELAKEFFQIVNQ